MNENSGYVKIGFATDLDARLQKIQLGTPDRLFVVHKFRTRFYAELEKILHQRFAHKRLRGEWFDLNQDDFNYLFSLKSETAWTRLQLYYPDVAKAVKSRDSKKFINADWTKWMNGVEIFPES